MQLLVRLLKRLWSEEVLFGPLQTKGVWMRMGMSALVIKPIDSEDVVISADFFIDQDGFIITGQHVNTYVRGQELR